MRYLTTIAAATIALTAAAPLSAATVYQPVGGPSAVYSPATGQVVITQPQVTHTPARVISTPYGVQVTPARSVYTAPQVTVRRADSPYSSQQTTYRMDGSSSTVRNHYGHSYHRPHHHGWNSHRTVTRTYHRPVISGSYTTTTCRTVTRSAPVVVRPSVRFGLFIGF